MARNNYFNEATRVQLPALIHLNKLGYEYIGKINDSINETVYCHDTNILTDIFLNQFKVLNPTCETSGVSVLNEIRDILDYDDLGRSFFRVLQKSSPYKLIDFEHIDNNVFHYTAEFTCRNGEDNFRPDITLFVNGLPLVFIEVKKPNNKEGILAETRRLEERFKNKKFRRFINITQFIILSNNMEYDTLDGVLPVQGAFYTTVSKDKVFINCFREEKLDSNGVPVYVRDFNYKEIDNEIEKRILKDFNCEVLYNAVEYTTNKNINTPTNRIITSMCSKERLLYILRYGLVYLDMDKEINGKLEVIYQKHIMRYQQLFASKAVTHVLSNGIKSGIIWHTQGSGKTALSYYLHKVLTDYYSKSNTVAKFYFIVDRLDLLEQASKEFIMRGLKVIRVNSRNELIEHFRELNSSSNNVGEPEIVVINIQQFSEDKDKIIVENYATNLQRVFIIDEAHRSYNPNGSFLANLFDADRNAIKIALTGTPLLKDERESWRIFGDYIHTYYYDKSIQDGYTLKIMREDIQTEYRTTLLELYDKIETLVQKKDIKKSYIVEHESYVKALLKYIVKDFSDFRLLHGDNSLGGMIVCESAEQARKIYEFFNDVQQDLALNIPLKASLILHDVEDKEFRKKIIEEYKNNMTIDFLIVYNMLLTGFDAPRLKRLYLCRQLKEHTLLQCLTRVNRPYKSNKYGYVVDFADIKQNFIETNEKYLQELSRFDVISESEENISTFNQIIVNREEIIKRLEEIKEIFFQYTTDNMEMFNSEISEIEDKDKLIHLRNVINEMRDFYNIVRTFGDDDLKSFMFKMDISSLTPMLQIVASKIDSINLKESFEDSEETRLVINEAMGYIKFNFKKLSEEELVIIGGGIELQEKWKEVIDRLSENIDHEDLEFITLRDAFVARFKENNFQIRNMEEYKDLSGYMDSVIKRIKALNNANTTLANKYGGDTKYVRIHNRIREENKRRSDIGKKDFVISSLDTQIFDTLSNIKGNIDEDIFKRNDILNNEGFFEGIVLSEVTKGLQTLNVSNTRDDRMFISHHIVKEYTNQYKELIKL